MIYLLTYAVNRSIIVTVNNITTRQAGEREHTMKTYEITYSNGNDIYSANLVIAESAEQAAAYYTAKGREVIGCAETMSRPKPGQPVVTVPEGWTAPAAEPETETAETEQTEHDARIIDIMETAVDHLETRSAWARGVKAYAEDLLHHLRECAEWSAREGEPSPLESRESVRAALLNGARDWKEYSHGGCSLIYSGDIAERLCSHSELKRKRGGELPPNRGEDWLDVQARALHQATGFVVWAYDAAVYHTAREGARV